MNTFHKAQLVKLLVHFFISVDKTGLDKVFWGPGGQWCRVLVFSLFCHHKTWWIIVIIGSGNGLLPGNNKTLPWSMLANHHWDLGNYGQLKFDWICKGLPLYNIKSFSFKMAEICPSINELNQSVWQTVNLLMKFNLSPMTGDFLYQNLMKSCHDLLIRWLFHSYFWVAWNHTQYRNCSFASSDQDKKVLQIYKFTGRCENLLLYHWLTSLGHEHCLSLIGLGQLFMLKRLEIQSKMDFNTFTWTNISQLFLGYFLIIRLIWPFQYF